ncbi:hypothetical protein LCGC14_0356130 [marine sediment metagenome]|uniref:PD-(D/E)XK endonuclease-like domain-containing protein n=1 Tax=marine sediment metagenome TaxID=412755 RepID=A0A0F9VWP2_9ZZZZ
MKKRKLYLSASSIAAFKSCPMRFNGAYVLGIRQEEDTEALRMGSNWHRILEVTSMKPGDVCPVCAKTQTNSECTICRGTDTVSEKIMDAVARELNAIYDKDYADPEKMEIEQIKLLYSLVGYRWYYQNQLEVVITREQKFDLSLINPESGRGLPNVILVGKIDKLVNLNGRIAVKEHKSTGSSVDPDSSYWGHLNLDTQTTLYLYAARRLQADGLLAGWGINAEDPPINTIIYDVWHKPTIKPKKLTQAESKGFLQDGIYCNSRFDVIIDYADGENPLMMGITVNGHRAEIKPGVKAGTFQIHETPEMYGARLLQDITERPEFYFRCVEMTRTQQEMEAFEHELLSIYRNMQSMIRTGYFYRNEHQCEATFKCDYIGQCYNGIELSVDNVPEGMKCIFDKEKTNDSH